MSSFRFEKLLIARTVSFFESRLDNCLLIYGNLVLLLDIKIIINYKPLDSGWRLTMPFEVRKVALRFIRILARAKIRTCQQRQTNPITALETPVTHSAAAKNRIV